MKIIHYINSFIYIITLALYLTIFYGLMAQIVLGFLQVLFSLILLVDKKKLRPPGINHLRVYHIVVIIYAIMALIPIWLQYSLGDHTSIPLYMILPMLIATYFVWITYQYQKQAIACKK